MASIKNIYTRVVANLFLLYPGFKPVYLPLYIAMLPFSTKGRLFLKTFLLDFLLNKKKLLLNLITLEKHRIAKQISTSNQLGSFQFIILIITDNNSEHLTTTLQSIAGLNTPVKEIIQYSENPDNAIDMAYPYFRSTDNLLNYLQTRNSETFIQFIYAGDQLLSNTFELYNSLLTHKYDYVYYSDEIIKKEDSVFSLHKPDYIPYQENEWGFMGKSILIHLGFFTSHKKQTLNELLIDRLQESIQIQHIKFQPYLNCTKSLPVNYKKRSTSAISNPGLISIVIPTRNKKTLIKNCIESIIANSVGYELEILIIDNGSDEEDFHQYMKEIKQKYSNVLVLRYDIPFNYSRLINLGVSHSKGDYLILMNNDIEVHNKNWLTTLLYYASQKEVGMVGCKLLFSNALLQHAGIAFDEKKLPYHQYAGLAENELPYIVNSNYAIHAVTGALSVIMKEKFNLANGYEEAFEVDYNDILFCLNLESKGFVNLYVSIDEIFHHESVSRGQNEESILKYRKYLEGKEQFLKHIALYKF